MKRSFTIGINDLLYGSSRTKSCEEPKVDNIILSKLEYYKMILEPKLGQKCGQQGCWTPLRGVIVAVTKKNETNL